MAAAADAFSLLLLYMICFLIMPLFLYARFATLIRRPAMRHAVFHCCRVTYGTVTLIFAASFEWQSARRGVC